MVMSRGESADEFGQASPGVRASTDLLYAMEASRNYDPSPQLERITAPLLAINSADDFINPPELGIMETAIKRVKRGRYVLLPVSEATRGHGTHTWAGVWEGYLREFLARTYSYANLYGQ